MYLMMSHVDEFMLAKSAYFGMSDIPQNLWSVTLMLCGTHWCDFCDTRNSVIIIFHIPFSRCSSHFFWSSSCLALSHTYTYTYTYIHVMFILLYGSIPLHVTCFICHWCAVLHAALFESFVQTLNFFKSFWKGHTTYFSLYGHYQVLTFCFGETLTRRQQKNHGPSQMNTPTYTWDCKKKTKSE
jgi:hypothetical protein